MAPTKSNKKKKESTVLSADELLENLISDYTTIKQDKIRQLRRGKMNPENFMEDVKNHVETYFDVEPDILEETLLQFERYIFSYSRITPLIEAKDISDIRCLSYDNIRIKENGKRKDSGICFRNKEEYKNFVEYVATRNKIGISNRNAIQRFTDTQSSDDFILRFTIAMPLVNTYDEPYLVIRKVPKNFPEIENLIEKKMMSRELAEDLVQRFRTGSTIICGGNSSGKTTLLNALKETLPEDMSVLIAQQADELTTKWHPDMTFMHSLPSTSESHVAYDLKDISIAGLTMDVDFFIVGEVKGGESIYVINAAYTGQLCALTIHAPSARQANDKVVDYAMYESRYSRDELMKMLTVFKNVIFMKGYKVDQVYEATGWNPEKKEIEYITVYERGKDGAGI